MLVVTGPSAANFKQSKNFSTPAEDAVLCVEDGQVLVHHGLQLPVAAAAAAGEWTEPFC